MHGGERLDRGIGEPTPTEFFVCSGATNNSCEVPVQQHHSLRLPPEQITTRRNLR
jgi:hypothetical protein